MRRIAAIGPCHNVTAKAGRASWPSMTTRTAINQPRADREVGFDVPNAVSGKWSNSLQPRVLALKELTSAANRAKGIAPDDEHRRVKSHDVTATRSCLFSKRFVNPYIRRVGCNCLIGKLCVTDHRKADQSDTRK